MARVTADELRTHRPMIDREKMAATTEADIHRHGIEDGEPADGDLPDGMLVVPSARLRLHLGMSQTVFAQAIGVPLKTVQNWEQGRTPPDPAARTLLALVAADPRHVLGLLGWAERDDVPDDQALEAETGTQSARKDKPTGRWFQRDADLRRAKMAARRA
ncbi:hypothetical protein AFCDBAGC_3626 [Methylobacterium cerastii]|uniref:HTH cro/C1-type domain-containing protein n=2 Tax=Methylobacteriaceae TaxID=119045 RepID=A0ABQ4QKM6_9HYPH|nr:helix-turn-helix domain-containing protein [Methylobacterium sp. WL122]TXN81220.1 helix-turn-helix domain-containing protein [Methylobacterium sp. WL8]GJD45749.1 hypothetical protein AFCDBAGC_3626 [Methylobacterium cerastii]